MKLKTIIEVCYELKPEDAEIFKSWTDEERKEFFEENRGYISELILNEFPEGSRILNINFEMEESQ